MSTVSARPTRKIGWLVAVTFFSLFAIALYKLSPAGRAGSAMEHAIASAKGAKLALGPEDLARLNPPVDEQNNAASTYREAMAMRKDMKKALMPLEGNLEPKTHKPYSSTQIDAAIQTAKPLLDIVERADAKPGLNWNRDWSRGAMVLFPEFAELKSIARYFNTRAEAKERRGDHLGALHDLRESFKIARKIGEEPVLIADLVRVAIEAMTFRSTGYILDTCPVNDETLAAMRGIADETTAPRTSADVVRFETCMFESTMNAPSDISELAKMFGSSADGDGPQSPNSFDEAMMRWTLKTPGMKKLVHAKMLENQAKIVHAFEDNADKPYVVQVKANKEMEAEIDRDTSVSGKVAGIFKPVYAQYIEARTRNIALRESFRAITDALALQRPALASALSTPIRTAKPHLDPFTGSSILSIRDKEGVKVYSVGPDLVDDGGAVMTGGEDHVKMTDSGILIGKPRKK